MKERPILFSGPMVRALLDGSKTQTRRIVKDAYGAFWDHAGYAPEIGKDGVLSWRNKDTNVMAQFAPSPRCPFGIAGDALWVRETWQSRGVYVRPEGVKGAGTSDAVIEYRADGVRLVRLHRPIQINSKDWRPSIFMPRWACRIVLEITSVRVERVASISTLDAIAEGCPWTELEEGNELGYMPPEEAYRELWDSLNAKRGYGWAKNPWVWVIAFQRKKGTEVGG